jgi:hypothetical protein
MTVTFLPSDPSIEYCCILAPYFRAILTQKR